MKKISKYLLFIFVIGLFLTLASCKTKVKKNTTTDTGPTPTVVPTTTTPEENKGTLDNPLTVLDAIRIGEKLPKNSVSNDTYYIKAYIWGEINSDDATHYIHLDEHSIYVDGLTSQDNHSYGTNYGPAIPVEAYEYVTYLCHIKNDGTTAIITDAILIDHERIIYKLQIFVNSLDTTKLFGYKYNELTYYGDITPSLYFGTSITLEAIVPDGYEFVGWYGVNNSLISDNNKYEFVIEKDMNIYMKWEVLNPESTYTLTTINDNPSAGTITEYTNKAFGANSSVTLEATPNTGFTFDGWYNGTTLVNSSSPYTFKINSNLTLTAKWNSSSITPDTYTLTTINDNPSAGTITTYENESFEAGTTVTLTAAVTPGSNYGFDGWYDGSTKVNSSSTYTFEINSNLTLTAKWYLIQSTYTLTTINDNPSAGTITEYTNEVFDAKSFVQLTATPNTGYRFDGWYDGAERISDSPSFNFTINGNLTLKAKWIKTYTLTTTNDNQVAGTITEYTNEEYDANTSITISASVDTDEGYTFNGWYDLDTNQYVTDGTQESYTFNINKDTHLKAMWTYYTLTTKPCYNSSNDIPDSETYYNIGGYFTIKTDEKVTSGQKVELNAAINEHSSTWVGWYLIEDGNLTLLSEDLSVEYEMTNNDAVIVAKFLLYKFVSGQTNVVEYGFYPQSKVADTETELLARLNANAGDLPTEGNNEDWKDYGYRPKDQTDSFMWYKDIYDEETAAKYRGVYFVKYRPQRVTIATNITGNDSNQYDNEYFIETVYWFKFDPVIWDIVGEHENTHDQILVSRFVIDAQEWYLDNVDRVAEDGLTTIYPNNYEKSTIKAWLNENFYGTVFDIYRDKNNCINLTDNSAESTGATNNQYALDGIFADYAYLLSYQEARNYLNGKTYEQARPTDYAKCQGAVVATSGSSTGYSTHWLRSPGSGSKSNAKYLAASGLANNAAPVTTLYGIRPAVNMYL